MAAFISIQTNPDREGGDVAEERKTYFSRGRCTSTLSEIAVPFGRSKTIEQRDATRCRGCHEAFQSVKFAVLGLRYFFTATNAVG